MFQTLKNVVPSQLLGKYVEEEILMYIPTVTVYALFLLIIGWFVYGVVNKEFSFEITKKKAAILTIILLVGLLARVAGPQKFGAGGGDELYYVSIAEEVMETGRFAIPSGLDGYSFFIKSYYTYTYILAPFTLFFNSFSAGRGLNILLGVLTVLGVFVVGKKFFNEKTGYVAAGLMSGLPLGIYLSNTTESQVVSVLLITVLIPVFKNYLDKETFFWGLGSTLFLSALVMSRTFNWTYLLVFLGLLLYYQTGFREQMKEYIVYGLVFVSTTFISVEQTLSFGFREDGGEISFFGTYFLDHFKLFLGRITGSVFYSVVSVIGLTGVILSKGKEKISLLIIPLLVHTFSMLSYQHTFQNYPMPKFFYFSFTLLLPFVAYALVEAVDYIPYKKVSLAVLVLLTASLTGIGIFEGVNYREETLLERTESATEFFEQEYPDCSLIVSDIRPIDPVIDGRSYMLSHDEKEKEFYRENFGDCIILYMHRYEIKERHETFLEKFEHEKIEVEIPERYGENEEAWFIKTG